MGGLTLTISQVRVNCVTGRQGKEKQKRRALHIVYRDDEEKDLMSREMRLKCELCEIRNSWFPFGLTKT